MGTEPTPGTPGLRVALVCPYSLSRPGGVQGQVIGLARSLEHRGHQVTVFAPLDDQEDTPIDVDLVAVGRSVALPSNGSVAPVSISPRGARRALAAVRLGRFDVVHIHEPFSPGLPYGLLMTRDVPPLVATFHRSGGSIFYALLRPLAWGFARHIAIRCAVSEAARHTAHLAVGGTYDVLFNGVEIDRYGEAEPWPSEGPTVLFLGRHEERKGLRVLLEAFARLEEGPAPGGRVPMLWVAGDGPETDQLQRWYPGSPTLQWLGVLTEGEKLRRLAAADVLCAPSLGGESFGMVLLEAMAARTLVVASDIEGYRQAADGHAVLVAPGDAGALAEALSGVLVQLADPADPTVGAIRDAARLRAENWSMDRLAGRYEEIYRKAMEHPAP